MPHPQAGRVSDKSHCQTWRDDKCLTNTQGEGHAWNWLSYKLDHISLLLLSSVSVYQYYSNSIFSLLLWGPLKEVTYVWIFKPVVSHIKEETMLLSLFFYCIWTFLCRCCSFNLSLCCLSPFLLSYVAVSRPYVTWWNFTLTGPVLYLPYRNTGRHDKVKYPQSVYSGREQGVGAFRFPPFPLLSPVPLPPLILPGFYLPIPLHYTSNPSHCSPNHLKEHDGQKSQTLRTIIVWGYRETAELSPRLIKSLS